ncbi:outer membrane cobalamin receptor [Dokdonia sp. Hel_I_63]|uniref:TonB-dependent receptor n=1 Tax=Dokdonia sp. Hel_I_63 TaxID=1249996 RepID=UPI0011994277|nr:TonB-dependent receptor [Dokdonia sp. Hel_I_63]TVZ23487.1 outer membrane cobalamin receptor [Dokdonia sp. Hel_I_63]
MKSLLHILVCLLCYQLAAQTVVSGKVTDSKGIPIEGANIFIDGTYDGASTAADGSFSFTTSEEGTQLLKVTFLSYEPYESFMEVTTFKDLKITLREDVNSLDTVVLSAGTFEASDNSKVSVLKPLDVVTTASALGDFVGALQTLPGTTTVAEDGRLFVRGGDAGETQIFIDGIRVFTPYTPTANNTPTRGRYSPFLFDGITFSTGGYSAEYGEALSSVLLLNTIDEPDQNKTDISLMSVGGGLGITRKWEKSSLSVSTSYINLAPYVALFSNRNNFNKPFQTFSGEAVYRYRTENGLFKLYAAGDKTSFDITQEDINNPEGFTLGLKNTNVYINTNYTGMLSNTWSIQTGGSYTSAQNDTSLQSATNIDNKENSAHLKVKLKKRFSNRLKLAFGAEHFITNFKEDFNGVFDDQNIVAAYDFKSNISAAFAESDIIFSRDFALKLGARASYTDYMEGVTFSPRVSLAYKTGKNSQFSLAYGDFYQNPLNDFLKFSLDLDAQKTTHYIANYQYSNNGRIFRAEAYRKSYSDLITSNTVFNSPESVFANEGNGYAQGVDVFWRDNTSIKNMDYWVSYSYLDSERKYLNFEEQARPSFASPHNLSVVGKYFIKDWKSQVGVSFQHSSGRTYTDRNISGFLQANTKSFNSLSVNWAYLLSQQKILYFSVNNVLGLRNVNGYQYADTPNPAGTFDRRALRPATDQFFFVGFFWTISDDKNSNQLDNL